MIATPIPMSAKPPEATEPTRNRWLSRWPALAGDKRYADAVRGYLRSETIAPLPLLRLAAAHPDTVDAVSRKILRKPDFTWAEHGEALLRRRKAWYYEREPRPGVSVIGARLAELARGGRRRLMPGGRVRKPG